MEYTMAIGRNISSARGWLQLSQTAVAERMRDLGFAEWRQQTIARVEKGSRRLMAEEVVGLAICLETGVMRLLRPVDRAVELRPGFAVTELERAFG